MMFKPLEGDSAILYQKGVFKQCDLATRNGYLFAKVAGGYVRLYANGSTSRDSMKLDTLAVEGTLHRDRLGRLCDGSVTGCSPLSAPQIALLTDGR